MNAYGFLYIVFLVICGHNNTEGISTNPTKEFVFDKYVQEEDKVALFEKFNFFYIGLKIEKDMFTERKLVIYQA
jgi:hypothetical protein